MCQNSGRQTKPGYFETFWQISRDLVHIFSNRFLSSNRELKPVVLSTMNPINEKKNLSEKGGCHHLKITKSCGTLKEMHLKSQFFSIVFVLPISMFRLNAMDKFNKKLFLEHPSLYWELILVTVLANRLTFGWIEWGLVGGMEIIQQVPQRSSHGLDERLVLGCQARRREISPFTFRFQAA